ncbi:helix-turn-helix domain-containing protein [Streptomyces daliensis]|uniref:Helix-turn-helix transcriptional regulator n=1 Tax=Streptomyces daliensis TaxID=299421 RepID=A0A8T4IRE2_9ACTN|nr:helix-turn-helix transcriptional regulator [Streptomyces daliensis]
MQRFTDMPPATRSNGSRLAGLRRGRRWTQSRLARETGYSLAAVKAFEQGRRSLDRGSVILEFARALDCHPAEITGQPYTPEDQEGQEVVAAIAGVRRALLRHGRPARPTDEEASRVDLVSLTQRVAQANAARQSSALPRSAEVLPGLLRDVQVAVDVLEGESRRQAYALLMSAYECSMQFLYKLGRDAESTLAVERVVWAAEQTENPLLVHAANWYLAGEYLSIGEHHDAADIIDTALRGLGTPRTPEATSLTGAFHLKAALNGARGGDGGATDRHLEHAREAADKLGGDRNDFQLQFGPTNTAIWSVSLCVERGRGREAVRTAEHVNRDLPADYSAERRGHHWIDVGRGYWYNSQRDEALSAFLTAEKIAPQQTRMNPAVRETVRTMIRTQRRSGLVELGMRVGAV